MCHGERHSERTEELRSITRTSKSRAHLFKQGSDFCSVLYCLLIDSDFGSDASVESCIETRTGLHLGNTSRRPIGLGYIGDSYRRDCTKTIAAQLTQDSTRTLLCSPLADPFSLGDRVLHDQLLIGSQ